MKNVLPMFYIENLEENSNLLSKFKSEHPTDRSD